MTLPNMVDSNTRLSRPQPLLSVLVPAFNAGDYLDATLQSLAKSRVSSDLVEFVVEDNGSDPHKFEDSIVEDERFSIAHESRRRPMASNWEAAYNRSRGDWIVYLGHDDGIVPPAFDALVQFLMVASQDVVILDPALFTYGGTRIRETLDECGSLHFYLGPTTRSRRRLLGAARKARSSAFHMYKLPIPYVRAVVRKQVLDQICSVQKGQLIMSTVPDWYLGMAIAHVATEAIVYRGCPPFIGAASQISNGVATVSQDPGEQAAHRRFWEIDARGGISRQTSLPDHVATSRLLANHIFLSCNMLRGGSHSALSFVEIVKLAVLDEELPDREKFQLLRVDAEIGSRSLRALLLISSVLRPALRAKRVWRTRLNLAVRILFHRQSLFRLRIAPGVSVAQAAGVIAGLMEIDGKASLLSRRGRSQARAFLRSNRFVVGTERNWFATRTIPIVWRF